MAEWRVTKEMEILLKKEDDMKIHCQEVIFISKEAVHI